MSENGAADVPNRGNSALEQCQERNPIPEAGADGIGTVRPGSLFLYADDVSGIHVHTSESFPIARTPGSEGIVQFFLSAAGGIEFLTCFRFLHKRFGLAALHPGGEK